MTTLADRLKQAREKAGLTQKELAARIQISQQAIQALEKGASKRSAHIHRFAEALQVNPMWLETGEGMPDLTANRTNVQPGTGVAGEVPLISWVQAGNWCAVHDPYPPGLGEKMIPVTQQLGPNSFALRIEGDSMVNPHGFPSFPEGSIIIVDPSRQWENRSYVVARLNDQGAATFKQIVHDAGELYLKPLNPDYKPLHITDRDVTVCGVAVQVVQELY